MRHGDGRRWLDRNPESAGRLSGLQSDMAGIPRGLWQPAGRALVGERSTTRPHLRWATPTPHRTGGLAPPETPGDVQQLQSGLRGTEVKLSAKAESNLVDLVKHRGPLTSPGFDSSSYGTHAEVPSGRKLNLKLPLILCL